MTQTQPGTLPAYHVLRERNDGGSVTYQPVDGFELAP